MVGMVLFLGASGTKGQEVPPQPCQGKYKGKLLSSDELTTVLTNHAAWVQDLTSGKVRQDTPDKRRANLCGATVHDAQFQEADLEGVQLQGANLLGAIITAAILDPQPGSLPDTSFLVSPAGLEEVTVYSSPQALVAFRQAFKNAGMREQQRQLTYAINYTQTHKALKEGNISEKIEAVFKWVMFEKTCEFGWFPGRPLRILGILLLVFAIPYRVALSTKGSSGIWAIWLRDRVHKSDGQETPVRVTDELLFSRFTVRQQLRECCSEAKAQRGGPRQEVTVETCFAPLVAWGLSWWEGNQLAVAVAATTLGQRFVVLVVSVLSRGCALPVAWTVFPATAKPAWRGEWLRMLRQVRTGVPRRFFVLVLADRGL
jgi:hypothetical protein